VAPGDVTYVEITIPQTNDLLKSGTLDAAAATEPMRSRIVQDGSGYRVADFVVQISPDILAAIWMAKRSWAASHAREIAAFRAALADAIGFIASHRQEVSAIEVKYLKIASPSHPVYDLSLKAADLKVYQDIMLEMTLLAQPVALDSIVAKESK